MSQKHHKVLIVSHNAISDTQSNGKTISSLFAGWDKDCLAQLYLTTDVPDFTLCQKYFQLHDFDALKRLIFKSKYQGRRVYCESITEAELYKDNVKKNVLLNIIRNNISPLFRLIRDVLWNISGYKTGALKNFLDDFKPDIVFFQSSSGVFAFSIVKWICTSRNIPLVMQVTDDYVTGRRTYDPFFWLQLRRLNDAFKWAITYCECVVAIGDKMAEEYKRRFGGTYYIAMNSVSVLNLPVYKPSTSIIKLLYAGNLGLNRWKVLAVIGECIKEINEEYAILGELSIYSLVEPSPKELSHLLRPPYSSFKGALNTHELNTVKSDIDILVHVEAFDNINKHVTRLSISTKIPEYLASGRCIFAVGPDDVASIEYLSEYDLGVVVTTCDKRNIKESLKKLMINSEQRVHYAQKGLIVADERHNAESVANDIFQIITSSTSKKIN